MTYRVFSLAAFIYGAIAILALLLGFSFCANRNSVPDLRSNIVLIVADDLGYSDLGCFGSEISTPNIDALAAQGQIFTSFYTAAACSPTRAMLLTGVDHHQAGLGDMAERMISIPEEVGQPGYEGYLNGQVVSVAQLLLDAGYHTYMAGKWHLGLTPDQSPGAKGFERSFALLEGYANHFYPNRQQATFWKDDEFAYYPDGQFSTDLYTDKLLQYLKRDEKDNVPFFLYAAYTAPHWPLQAPDEYLRKYEGKYDQGYESLRRNRLAGLKHQGLISDSLVLPSLPKVKGNLHNISERPLLPWDSLSVFEQAVESKKMEIYAAMIDNLDANIGRLIAYLKKIGAYENTLFIFISDNGAAALEAVEVPDVNNAITDMGTTNSFVAYGPQWAHASSAYNYLYKGYSSEGGIHTPMIIKTPHQKVGKNNSSAFCSVLDIAPTLLDLAGIKYPSSHHGSVLVKYQGASLLPYLNEEANEVHEDDYVMGWELFGRCALRKGKYKIAKIEQPFGSDAFQLFDIEQDPTESIDLAKLHPGIYQEMLDHWEEYVKENGVILTKQ
jgi:arylsulfatase